MTVVNQHDPVGLIDIDVELVGQQVVVPASGVDELECVTAVVAVVGLMVIVEPGLVVVVDSLKGWVIGRKKIWMTSN